MKILHVLSQRPDSTGSGIYIQAMLREASRNEHINFLMAGVQSDWPAQLDGIDDDRCRFVTFGKADIPFTIVGMSDVMPYASSRFCDLSQRDLDQYESAFSSHLSSAVEAFQPDIIHSHHLWILTSLTRQLFPHIPLATTCHGSDLRQFRNCPHLQGRVLSGCLDLDAVMALTRPQKNEIVQRYGLPPEKVHVVGAGFNHQLFFQTAKPDPEPVQIVYAGKLSNAKGVPWMLQALSQVDVPDWHLHLVGGGSGAEKKACLRLAGELGDRVTVHGAVYQSQLAGIMKQSHVFVLPSFYEGLPLVVLEGLASGCRIVATDLPGTTEILGDMQIDGIDLVATPRLQDVDRPVAGDESRFEKNLKEALQRQIRAARQHPQIDLSAIADRIAAFSWSGIFGKVRDVYSAAVKCSLQTRS